MIPTMIKINITQTSGKNIRFIFPVIIIWIILFAFITLFSPLMVIIAILTWPFGYGKLLLVFPVMIYSVLVSLRDLLIDIRNNKEAIYISFY